MQEKVNRPECKLTPAVRSLCVRVRVCSTLMEVFWGTARLSQQSGLYREPWTEPARPSSHVESCSGTNHHQNKWQHTHALMTSLCIAQTAPDVTPPYLSISLNVTVLQHGSGFHLTETWSPDHHSLDARVRVRAGQTYGDRHFGVAAH